MKLSELKPLNEDDIPAMGNDGSVSPEMDEQRIDHDEKNNRPPKSLKVGRGDNHKKAKRIAAMARTDARATDSELSDDNPPQPFHGGYARNNFRLAT